MTSSGHKVVGIIPARLGATRFPNKPLADICGKSMIQRVWERSKLADCLSDVYVATPDDEILKAVEAFGGLAIMTSSEHRSGTDRLAEAASNLDADIVVNIQGDEPLIDPIMIRKSVEPFHESEDLQMTSLMCPCPEEEIANPATVKVVAALNGDALYFSRASLPFMRSESPAAITMQHIGLYAYRREFLLKFPTMPPTPLESTELLEQLRVLENGYRIRMVRVESAPLSVDTAEDYERVCLIIAGMES